MIHAFHFAPVNKQLICRDLKIFFKSNPKNFKSNLKLNPDLCSRIFTLQIESPNELELRFKSQLQVGFAHHCLSQMSTLFDGAVRILSLQWAQVLRHSDVAESSLTL